MQNHENQSERLLPRIAHSLLGGYLAGYVVLEVVSEINQSAALILSGASAAGVATGIWGMGAEEQPQSHTGGGSEA